MWNDLDEFNDPTTSISPEAIAIANGHAFDDHIREFPEIKTREQFAQLINNIMNNPTDRKPLRNNRTVYWDDASGTIVIEDPCDADGGTAFRPSAGRQYFDEVIR